MSYIGDRQNRIPTQTQAGTSKDDKGTTVVSTPRIVVMILCCIAFRVCTVIIV